MCINFSIASNMHYGFSVIYVSCSICQFVIEVKYLGVLIDSSMKTKIDIVRQTRKFYLQPNSWQRILGIALIN